MLNLDADAGQNPAMQDHSPDARAFIARLSDSLVGAHSLEELVRPLLELLEAVTGLESTYMTAIDEVAGLQHILYARNTRRLQIPEGLSVPWDDTLCKRALDEGRMYTDDVADCWGDSDAARALGIASYASTPIHGKGGHVYGTLCAASDERKPLTNEAERVLRMFSTLIGQQVERAQLVQELRAANQALAASALTDVATGLPNRRALMEELARRLARGERNHNALLVAFIDLDGFKAINDRHGHEAGDRLLAAIAGALTHASRAGDFCARLGGDEFVVLASVPAGDGDAALAAMRTRLHDATRGRFALGEDVVIEYGGPSIGLVLVGDDIHDADTALARADAAMYATKRERKAAAR